ncbi:coiled-coil domain-containing protein [Pararobbsia silviterrae]|uniref:Acetate kinase n=1 Tax=Pararobbsia silviterrae TaxID=1792498 RepID=A0A494Y0Q3_9BURK|nr:acetate kinase [Pararobbsia silviterrae]RKP56342.1 acetate kinase [Pararobbsia silviterrae]
MKDGQWRRIGAAGSSCLLFMSSIAQAQSLDNQDPAQVMQELRDEIDQRIKELDNLKHQLDAQEARVQALTKTLDEKALEQQRGGSAQGIDPNAPAPAADSGSGSGSGNGATSNTSDALGGNGSSSGNGNGNAANASGTANAPTASGSDQSSGGAITPAPQQAQQAQSGQSAQQSGAAQGQAPSTAQAQQPVGQAPVRDTRPPQVAPLFEQPGVLTPKGKLVVEPSVQYGYSSSDRVSLVGYTIIPALLIGLINIQEERTTTITNTVAFRYGVTNRFELEVRVPYAWSSTSTIERQIFQGTAQDSVFSTDGHGLGDVEMTARYQFNDGGADRLYYVGWLRFKSRTGSDPFSVTTDCLNVCEANTTGTGLPLQNPTGSGFYSLQPGITWLLPTDPAVFFGNFSYLHNFTRNDVSLTLLNGIKQPIGSIHAGDIFGLNFGMGMALNEKASWSIGYDQSIIFPTSENGQTEVGSVRTTLGTLLVGYSYALTKRMTLNVSVGAGLTRDTPDLTVTFRLPITF